MILTRFCLAALVSATALLSGCSLFGFGASGAEVEAPKRATLLDDLTKTDCGTLRQMLATARKEYLTDEHIAEGRSQPGEFGGLIPALIRCDDAKSIFEDVASVGPSRSFGASLLMVGEEKSSDALFEMFLKYATTNAGEDFLGGDVFAARHVGEWLLRTGRKDQCETLDAAAEGANIRVHAGLREYRIEAPCKSGIPIMVERLTDDDANVRKLACAWLALHGDKSALAAVEIVADNDSSFTFVERYSDGKYQRDADGRLSRNYAVAEMCTMAVQSIRGRNP